VRLILYSKPGCHLCEGLQAKLEQIKSLGLDLEIRDITTREEWWQLYQYEVPVLCQKITSTDREARLPRPSPRFSIKQLEQMLQKCMTTDQPASGSK